MKKNTLVLIDFDRVDTLLEGFNKSTGFVTAILDLDGNVLSKSGWRQMCTEFHRINPATSERCTTSDTELANKMAEGEKYHFYKCLNGLIDVAVPIIIDGKHVANLFSGQFFFEEPDISFFKKQAKKYGFDENRYLDALSKVPIVSEEKVKTAMDFLLNMTQMISDMAFQKLEQMELNNTIKKNEEKFKAVFESASVGKSITLPTGEINVNQAFCDMLGYTREELQNKKWQDITPHDEISTVQKILNPMLNGEKDSARFEKRYICKDGSYKWADVSVSLLRDEDDKPIHFITTVIDITERKKKEEELKKAALLLQSSIESPKDMIILCIDKNYNYLYFNECHKATMIYAYGKDVKIGMNLLDCITNEEDKIKAKINYDKALNGESHITIQEYGDIEKSYYETRYNPVFNDKNEIIGTTAFSANIKDRKLAEEALRLSEEKFSVIFQKAPYSATLSSISDLKLVDVNEQFEKYWGYSSAEAIGKASSELELYPDDNERARLSAIFREKGFIHDIETKMKSKSGELKDVLINSDIVKIGNEQFVLSTVQNITERKKIDFERHKFVMLADSSSEFIGMCDLNLQPVYVNPSGIRMVGLPDLAEACRVMVQDYFFPEDQPFIAEDFFPRVLLEGHGDVEIRLRHFQTGEAIWVYYYLFSVLNDSGTPIGWATVSRDITERKLANEEIKKQLDELQRWHQVTLGREGRILELKKEVNDLLHQRGEPLRYGSTIPENTAGETKV